MLDFLGYIGGGLFILCYIPQIHDIFYKEGERVNIPFFLLQLVACICMTIYGLFNNLLPIIILNLTSAFFLCVILCGILKKRNRALSP